MPILFYKKSNLHYVSEAKQQEYKHFIAKNKYQAEV